MTKYTLISDSNNSGDNYGSKVTIEFEGYCLDDILPQLESFLKASGFVLKGTLDIVEEESND